MEKISQKLTTTQKAKKKKLINSALKYVQACKQGKNYKRFAAYKSGEGVSHYFNKIRQFDAAYKSVSNLNATNEKQEDEQKKNKPEKKKVTFDLSRNEVFVLDAMEKLEEGQRFNDLLEEEDEDTKQKMLQKRRQKRLDFQQRKYAILQKKKKIKTHKKSVYFNEVLL